MYKIRVLTWELTSQHNSYLQFNSAFQNIFLTDSVHLINSYSISQGIKYTSLQSSTNEILKHSVSVKYNPFKSGQYPLNETVFFRSKLCEFCVKTEICETFCKIEKKYTQKKKSLKRKSVA